jgi:hypothetical protein
MLNKSFRNKYVKPIERTTKIPVKTLKEFQAETAIPVIGEKEYESNPWVAFKNKHYISDQHLFTVEEYDTRYKHDKILVLRIKREKTLTMETSMKCFMKGCLGTIRKESGVHYGHCDSRACEAVNLFYKPTPIQESFINNDHDTILVEVGGFGSGKTTASACKVFRHMLFIDNAYVLAGAQTVTQLRQTGQTELLKFIPEEYFESKTQSDWVLKNGSHIEWVPTDKEDKIRGRNLTLGWLIEANEIPLSVVDQMIARIRSDNAIVYELDEQGNRTFATDKFGTPRVKTLHNYCQLILESNPDPNSDTLRQYWVRARTFICTPSVKDPATYTPLLEGVGEDTLSSCVYLTTGLDNPYLDKKNAFALANLTGDAHKIFVLCDLSMKEGTVYPKWVEALVPDITNEIDETWPRIFAADFGGGSAPTAMLGAAINPETKVTYIYTAYQKIDSAIATHVPWMHHMMFGSENSRNAPWPIWACLGDPSGNKLREGNTRTVFKQYEEYGIPFSSAENSKGNRVKDVNGVTITNDLLATGMLKIVDRPSEGIQLLIKQLQTITYQYKPAKGNQGSATIVDKIENTPYRDEFADCLRYLAVWIAHNKEIVAHKPIVSINQKTPSGGIVNYNGRVAVGVNNQQKVHIGQTSPGVRVSQKGGQINDSRFKKGYWK